MLQAIYLEAGECLTDQQKPYFGVFFHIFKGYVTRMERSTDEYFKPADRYKRLYV